MKRKERKQMRGREMAGQESRDVCEMSGGELWGRWGTWDTI